MTAPDYGIAVLDRALDVLEALADAPAGAALGVTDIARRAGTTKSAAFRILANLERRGYIGKDPVTAKYNLGTRLAYLGERSLGAIDLRAAARPALEALHRRFGETVNLAVREGADVVYVDMIESEHGLRMAARVGSRDSLHSTALGKAILAALPPAERDRLLQGHLPARTERTITDPARLRAELERTREQGVAEDRDENELGARCLGAAIFNHRGEVAGAISVSAPNSRLDDGRAIEVAAALVDEAAAVSRRLGGLSMPPASLSSAPFDGAFHRSSQRSLASGGAGATIEDRTDVGIINTVAVPPGAKDPDLYPHFRGRIAGRVGIVAGART